MIATFGSEGCTRGHDVREECEFCIPPEELERRKKEIEKAKRKAEAKARLKKNGHKNYKQFEKRRVDRRW